MRLVACPSCARHLKLQEATCPFCAARIRSPASLTRAAAMGLALASAGLTACPDEQPIYGAPPIELDAGTTDTGVADAGS